MTTNKKESIECDDGILIRYVTPEDTEDWLRLWRLFQNTYESKAPKGVEEFNFKRFLDPNVKLWSALAIDTKNNDKAIGVVNFLTRLSTWDLTDIVYLHDLFVDANVRSRGVGRRLINFVYQEADRMGTPHVYWTTDHHNHRAQLLYTKAGELTSKVIYKRPGH